MVKVLIPSFYYGSYREVKVRSQKLVTRLRRGETLSTILERELVDTVNLPGLLVLHGPSPLIGATPQFQCFVPLLVVRKAGFEQRITQDILEQVFNSSLQTPWGVLGLLSEPNLSWLYPPEHHRPFLLSVLTFWDALNAEGKRYSNGGNWGMELWWAQNNLAYVLANLGVPKDLLRNSLPPEGLIGLLKYVRSPL